MKSKIVTLVNQNVIAYVSDLTDVANKAITLHQCKPLPALVLASAITAFGPLGIIKKAGKVITHLKGDGPVKSIIVESNSEGHLRALIGDSKIITEYDQNRFNDIPLNLGIGTKGTLKIVHQNKKHSFGSEVKMAKGDIVTDLAYYFDQSDQIYSAVQLSVVLAKPNKLAKAYGVIFQMLPYYQESDIKLVEKLVKTKALASFTNIDDYLKMLNWKIVDTKEVLWRCNCSYPKMKKVMQLIPLAERQEILAKEKKLEITCNFCQKKYDLTKEFLN